MQNTALVFAFLSIALSIFFVFDTPSSSPPTPGKAVSRYPKQETALMYGVERWISLIPERIQSTLGAALIAPVVARSMTEKRQTEIVQAIKEIYSSKGMTEHWNGTPSELGQMYLDLVNVPLQGVHYYLYVPQSRSPQKILFFFHGSFGNFQIYTELLSRLAETTGTIIVAPSHGFGRWSTEEGSERIRDVLDDVSTFIDLSQMQVFVAGQSAGGVGAAKFFQLYPRTSGMFLISPVFDTALFTKLQTHVFVLTGTQDEATTYEYVQNRVKAIQDKGVQVETRTFEGEDHYLMLTKWSDLEKFIEAHM